MFLVLSKRVFQASRDEEFIQENWKGDTEKRSPRRGSEYYQFSGSTEGSARYRHQSQRVRTLSRRLEVANEGTPQNVRLLRL